MLDKTRRDEYVGGFLIALSLFICVPQSSVIFSDDCDGGEAISSPSNTDTTPVGEWFSTPSQNGNILGMGKKSDTGVVIDNLNTKEELFWRTKAEVSEEFYYGADLSYINEMKDIGAIYRNKTGAVGEPYKIFVDHGANLIRFRLWHTPDGVYSSLDNVKKAMKIVKSLGSNILLDFHISDTWADPGHQQIPAAWAEDMWDQEALGELVYNYIKDTLEELESEGLTPEMVQIGNETNSMILRDGDVPTNTVANWPRNAYLFNKGLQAVRDFDPDVETMLHVAQPEALNTFFTRARDHGVVDYDWIGLSYYPQHSKHDLVSMKPVLQDIMDTFDKRLMVVEVAYPFTLENVDAQKNKLGEDALLEGYPATQQGQLDFLNDLAGVIKEVGGEGVIYWGGDKGSLVNVPGESRSSNRDNVVLFDHYYYPTLGMQFFSGSLKE